MTTVKPGQQLAKPAANQELAMAVRGQRRLAAD